MCTFSMEHIMHHKILMRIWGSDLRGFRIKGFGLARVHCTTKIYLEGSLFNSNCALRVI